MFTTIVVTKSAPKKRVMALEKRGLNVLVAPKTSGGIDLKWLMKKLGGQGATSLLVEGGGEVNASFLLGGLAQRVVFFYAPKILGGAHSKKGVGGDGIMKLDDAIRLKKVEWRRVGVDLMLTARIA